MPELPEVETVARQLAPLISGRSIKSVAILDAKLEGPDWPGLQGLSIASVFRSGKRIILELRRGRGNAAARYLSVHLRMTGRLIWVPDTAWPQTPPPADLDGQARGPAPTREQCEPYVYKVPLSDKSLRARFLLRGGELRFYDHRRFGVIELHSRLEEFKPAGLEPLFERFTAKALVELLAGARGEIKPWLLRQDKVVGIGNIYASEILFAAGLHPQRSGASLSAAEAQAVWRETRRILRLAIKHCGTTFSDFQDSTGSTGGFQRFLKVYGREGVACPRCGSAIERLVQQQRSTFFCPDCQR